MGLFDKFRKKIHKVVEDVDVDTLTAGEEQETKPIIDEIENPPLDEEEGEELNEEEPLVLNPDEDEWEDWDEDELELTLPTKLSRKEKRIRDKEFKKLNSQERVKKKELKRRGGKEVERLEGSNVDLHMMRTTTGRQLVKVKSTPKGSVGEKEVEGIAIDLGGGVVESGGKAIKENEALTELLEELEWIMLESDISSGAVTSVMGALKANLVGQKLRKGANLAKVLEASLKRALRSILKAGYWDFDASIQSFVEKKDTPVVVMFVGVNGTGKTTTVAKIANRLQKNGLSVIVAAGDTFRAGAIEQLETHCEKLNIRCISSQRGGDSAAIVRDAVYSAKAKNIDVVLVDTAGRMQNKTNLMAELDKVRRVANPHLTLFVGDALAGNDAVDQAKTFQEILKFDGAVLTKLDTDAKGGAGLSIAHATGRPIILCGIGQGYDDIIQFDPDWLLEQLFE